MLTNCDKVYEDLVGRGRRESTARRWAAIVRRFEACCGVKGGYGRGDVVKFLVRLRADGMSQNSINTVIQPIKLLSHIQGWKNGFPKLVMARVRRSEISRPVFSMEEMRLLIMKAKEVCSGRELAFLAMASTYGLRREEIGTLEICEGAVKVNTVKGGEVTTHLIPDEVKEFIKDYRGCKDVRYLTRVFQKVMGKVGLEVDGKRYGWHSIRRALASELLLRDVSLLNIVRFMRWSDDSLKSELGMLAIYAQRRQEDIDRSIFNVHPFLTFWVEQSLTDSAVGVECL